MKNDVNVRNLQGEGGFEILADTAVHAGPFGKLWCRTDATTFALGSTERTAGSIAGETMDRGEWAFGYFTNVKLSSGKLWAYPI